MELSILPCHATPDTHGEESALTLEVGADGRLRAARGDRRSVVHVRRCFPWSEPDRFLSLRDEEGEEFALVADPATLDAQSRAVLERALAQAGFVFAVTRVLGIDEEVELRHWRVVTRQGDRRFQTRLDEWPRRLPDGGFLMRDVSGDLYRFADPARMDRRSREVLWAFAD